MSIRRIAIIAIAAALLASACGSSDAETSPEVASGAAVQDAPTESAPAVEEASGVVRIDGVEHRAMQGQCEIYRSGFGEVGELVGDDLRALVAVDNVAAGDPDTLDDDMNFIINNNTERFRFRTTNQGTITSITELTPRVVDGSSEFVTIRFAGSAEDGRSVEADLPCEIQN